jgi:hypothetical protein
MAFTAASLTTGRRQLIGLLNGAGWTNIADGAMTATSATLTTTASIFASTDVGSTIAVLGAGATGATLTTTISAYTSGTQVTLAVAASTTVSNASVSFGGRFNDDKFAIQLIEESLFEGDERFYVAGAETKDHWIRPDIMDWSSDITTQGAETPAHTGELGEVRIKYVSTDSSYKIGKPMSAQELEIYRRNTDSYLNASHNATGTAVAGYYNREALLDGVCDFTGYALSVRVANYTRTSALQSPEAWISGIIAHAASVMFAFDGLDPQLALYFSREADKKEMAVRGNVRALAGQGAAV